VWVVTPSEVHHVELPPSKEIEPLVEAYQNAVDHQLADPLRTHLPAGEKLSAMLLEPVRKWIPAGSNVIVTPDGVLHGLNLESLPVPGDAPHYWIQDAIVSIAPSLALLASRPEGAVPPRRLLLIGDPVGFDPTFPPLVHAAPEIADVTQSFGKAAATVVTKEQATPDAYTKSAPLQYSAIHFTAHATANAESPLDSAVLLARGKLYARDVMAIPLSAGLVTFSACRGVGVRLYSGEGLVGFAWAFLHAGAHNVIAGLWDVNDQSTGQLMGVLYREMAAGKPPAAALRAAKLTLAESNGNLRKPYYWAPFQLYTVAP
jgi:CHAT domain-containing protein